MKKTMNEIIDADLYSVLNHEKKICYTVSVPHADKLIDADEVQFQNNEVKQHVCADVICA